ncbi:YTH domain-containing protein ECT4-like isoform X1 [Zingiber officinale]|uniref:YTH domain-containing protein ECT4-like isoform X1 n=1 Tax=Zingiber officinale TaxID=94328 RepID=UPI001C4D00E7|nr:YTH domain-containing protein ECT4-like isoform X1 [Zingiber officinale]
MAPVAPAADPSNLLQKLSLDPQPKSKDAVEATKQVSVAHTGSSNAESSNMWTPSEGSSAPVLSEFTDGGNYYVPTCYASPAYFFGGYDQAVKDWNDYSTYVNQDGMQGVYGDMYQGYGYAPYSAYPSNGTAVPAMGNVGKVYDQQQYQYPLPFFQTHQPTSSTHQGNLSSSVVSDQPSIPVDTQKNSNGIPKSNTSNGPGTTRSSHQNLLHASQGNGGYQNFRYSSNGIWSTKVWYDSPYLNGQHRPAKFRSSSSGTGHNASYSSVRNHGQLVAHVMGMNAPRPTPGMRPTAPLVSRMCGFGYGHSSMFMDGISHSEGQGNISFGNYHELSELNRGPRVVHSKNHKVAGPPPVISGKSQNLSSSGNENTGVSLDCEQYNREDFPDKYSDAKFFIIKSYSEDDIHKSIKYNVWASTPNGNKKLDAGYQKAHEKAGGCPVFLFFSVNTSGQFVGVAEMVGRVDFNKTVDYWQQDKWIGCFPVKWHIIKDVPNSNLKHITLESNENKPVTNSRDTQEVELEQGIQMLKIFKEHTSNTSLLDDFDFYEHRQHFMQVKRAKQQLQKQAWDGKTSHKPVEGNQVVGNEFNLQSDSVTNKEAVNSDHVQRTPVEIIATADAGDALKVTNGAASGVASGF